MTPLYEGPWEADTADLAADRITDAVTALLPNVREDYCIAFYRTLGDIMFPENRV